MSSPSFRKRARMNQMAYQLKVLQQLVERQDKVIEMTTNELNLLSTDSQIMIAMDKDGEPTHIEYITIGEEE